MPPVCKSCGCSDIDTDPARGDAVCTNCGSVVDDHLIVADIEFEENSAGGANVIGQFVSAEGGSNSLQLGQNFKQSLGNDSRQQIYNNGKQMINNMGSQLKLSRHCLDSAFMFYKLAVNRRLTQGRKTVHVVGACLYMVCRTEKTPHLLIDISDVTQTDVFTLGRVFSALSRELCIDVPSTDPSLYIHRFAHQLKFEDKENEVATTALRLVARMKRDWLSTGRRPSGLCGAALIVAARLHGFNRTIKDVVKIVRMSRSTILQRLSDFGKTASSKLTAEEFNKIDLEEEADPPSFTKSRERAKQAQVYEEKMKLSSSELLAQLALTQEKVEVVLSHRKIIEQELDSRETVLPDPAERRKLIRAQLPLSNIKQESESCSSKYNSIIDTALEPIKCESQKGTEDDKKGPVKDGEKDQELNSETRGFHIEKEQTRELTEKEKKEKEFQETIKLFNQTQQGFESDGDEDSDNEDEVKPKTEEEEKDWELDLEGLDDDELDDCLLCEEEVEIKTKVWMEENGDFLEQLKEKEEREALEQEKNEKKQKKKKPRRKKTGGTNADTADEAIKAMLAERKLSTKINYDVLRDLTADLDIGVNFDSKLNKPKVETKTEIQDSKDSLNKMPVVYESGPVEKKLRSRFGNKRPPSLPDASLIRKKIKTETGSHPSKESHSFIKTEAATVEKHDSSEKAICHRNPSTENNSKEVDRKPVVVETGPVITENESTNFDVDDDDYDEEGGEDNEAADEHISASQLFGRGEYEDDYGESYDMYGDPEY